MKNQLLVFAAVLAAGLFGQAATASAAFVSVAAIRITSDGGQTYSGHIGKGWADNEFQAEEEAMSACAYSGCEVLVTSNDCIGVSYDAARNVYASVGVDIDNAQRGVDQYCASSSASGGCTLWDTVCSNGYDSSQ